MQILEEKDFIEDPYKNTLFDDPIHNSSYYLVSNELFIGTLKLMERNETIINNYYQGLYKEELVTNYYPLQRGNDHGNFWHQVIGDSFVTKSGILLTEIWYSDSLSNRLDGYFASNALDISLPPFGFVSEPDIDVIESFYRSKKASKTMFKLKTLLGLESCNASLEELEEWKKEPIENYLEEIKELLKEED